MTDEPSDLLAERRAKLERLREAGIEPYPHAFADRTEIAAIREAQAADGSGDARIRAARAVHSLYRRSLRIALREPVDLRDLAIDGDDLREVGITPGPELGKILASLLAQVIEDPRRNTRDRLLEEARRLRGGGAGRHGGQHGGGEEESRAMGVHCLSPCRY